MNRLQTKYNKSIKSELTTDLELKNVNLTPKLEKIMVSAGVGRATADSKYLDAVVNNLTAITAQAPALTVAKHSVASFKLREGNKIGAKVTLRGERMWNFLDRLISVTLPRLRDFRGLNPASFDGQGNYNIGIAEHTVFPEVNQDEVTLTHGLQITIVTNTNSDAEAQTLLRKLGLPLRQEK